MDDLKCYEGKAVIPKATIPPPPGRPNWQASGDLPLLYLGWGRRDFARDPLAVHYDHGTNYFLVLQGEVVVVASGERRSFRGPVSLIFDAECPFGMTQTEAGTVEILVWIWPGPPCLPELRPSPGGYAVLDLPERAVPSLTALHERCRSEVAVADGHLPETLTALRRLVEVEILRGAHPSAGEGDVRWRLAVAWMAGNLAIHVPVPALCDYLRMSPSTLHRFFRARTGLSPGAYFRQLKIREAQRLIREEGWQVKAVAYHLGYRHPNDLSRALAAAGRKDGGAATFSPT